MINIAFEKIIGAQEALDKKKNKSNKRAKHMPATSQAYAKKRSNKSLERPKLGYKFGLFELNKITLSKFIFLKNRRRISKSQKASIKKAIVNNIHFDSPIVVNEVGRDYRVIDGNHRIEVFKELLKRDERFKLDILLIIYQNLDEDQEILIYRRWNVGQAQSLDDFIQGIAHKIPVIRWIKKDFEEVTVYASRDTVAVRTILSSYCSAKDKCDLGMRYHKQRFLEEIKKIGEKDYLFIRDFLRNFIDVFGKPENKNKYFRYCYMCSVMYIVHEYKETNLWPKFRHKILGNQELAELNLFTNREVVRKMIGLMKDLLHLKGKLI